MAGHLWDGSAEHYVHAPRHYGAIHFHHDDVDDVGWEADLELVVPDDLPSGVYGVAVFSTGSIAWCGSLAHAAYDNNVSRIIANVIDRFASDAPLP